MNKLEVIPGRKIELEGQYIVEPGQRPVPLSFTGPVEPTATFHSSATPAVGLGVHFTAGASSICNPGHRPDIHRIQQLLARGEPGTLVEEIDLDQMQKYRDYRRSVGLLPDSTS